MKRFPLILLVIFAIIFTLGQLPVEQVVLAETSLEEILTSYYTWFDEGDEDGVEFGYSVAGTGDYNGDGFADAVVGSPKFKISGIASGAVFIYNGTFGGLNNDPEQLTSPVQGARFGTSVSNAGDVNGDGYDDLIVGAEEYKLDSITGAYGAAFVFHGSEDGVNQDPNWEDFGSHKDARFGSAVCGAGDVNNDGYDDVLVSAVGFSTTSEQTSDGAVFLYLGSPDGLSAEPIWQYESDQLSANLGSAIAGIGDLDDDGYDDIVISSPMYDVNTSLVDAGVVYVFFSSGSETVLSASPDWSTTGTQPDEEFGSALAGAGDVDGNGYLDLIIGARGYNEVQADIDVKIGAAYLYSYSQTGLKITASWMVKGDQIFSLFGSSVTGLGDVNKDGYDDVAVGAPLHTGDQPDEGAVFVYRGSPAGLLSQPSWIAYGNKAETMFGSAVAGGGDFNHDGLMDILVGAPSYKHDNATRMGRAFSFDGIATGDLTEYDFHSYLPLLLGP